MIARKIAMQSDSRLNENVRASMKFDTVNVASRFESFKLPLEND